MHQVDEVLFDYIARGNPKSNEDLKKYLRRYPHLRDEIIEFTANWRALAILDRVLPPVPPDPVIEARLMQRARARLRSMRRRRADESVR